MSAAAPRATRRAPRTGEPLPASFYARDTELVARELLGAVLVSHVGGVVTAGRIVETEAYLGEDDPACHAAAGHTNRTRWLYGPPGTAYVYFIYGVHWCFNAVTRVAGLPSAVLVRALEPVDGLPAMWERRPRARDAHQLVNGPGKLCSALGITGEVNGLPLDRPPLLIRAGAPVEDHRVRVTPRVGITQAAEWPLRWVVADSAFTSRPPRGAR